MLGLPVAETLVSMARRIARRLLHLSGGGVFEADGEHIHHRLLKLGLNHRRAVMLLHGVGLVLATIGVGSMFLSHRQAAVLLLTIIAAGFVGLARLGYEEFAVIRRGDMLRLYEVPVLRTGLFIVFADITRTVAGVFVSTAALLAFARFWWPNPLPVTFYATYFLVASALLAGMRASYRVFSEWSHRAQRETAGEPILIYGAGFAGSLAVREILENQELAMRPIGFLDDDHDKLGRMVAGYPVFGSIDRLEELLSVQAVRGVVVASDKIPQQNVERLAEICERSGVFLKMFRVGFEERRVG